MARPAISEFITFLPTADLEATRRFYTDVLGLTLTLRQQGCMIWRTAEGAYLGFCERGEVLAPPARVVLTIVTDEVERWHAHFVERGIEPDGPVRENPTYQIVHFYVNDPNGYSVEVQRFLDSDWNRSS